MIDTEPAFDGIASSERTVFDEFRSRFETEGQRVLEVGGCLPWELARESSVAEWIALDPRNEDRTEQKRRRTLRGFAHLVPLPDNAVDLVFSSNAFQHIATMQSALFELHRVVRPGGAVFAHFGPIWSAPDGSHIEGVLHDDRTYNFWEAPRYIPDWYHLIFTCRELFEILQSRLPHGLARALAEYVYTSSWINRLTYEDYLSAFEQSGFELELIHGELRFDYDATVPAYDHPYQDRVARWLGERGPRLEQYKVRDLKVVLRKPAADN